MESTKEITKENTKSKGKLATYAQRAFMIIVGLFLVLAVFGAIYRKIAE